MVELPHLSGYLVAGIVSGPHIFRLALTFGMLLGMFQNLRLAAAVFAIVPLSLAGGMLGLWLRGMPFSLPAAVGFIALGGIAVLNGAVMASEVRRRLDENELRPRAACGAHYRGRRCVWFLTHGNRD
jgi:Cu/Ag efflux pump CusA